MLNLSLFPNLSEIRGELNEEPGEILVQAISRNKIKTKPGVVRGRGLVWLLSYLRANSKLELGAVKMSSKSSSKIPTRKPAEDKTAHLKGRTNSGGKGLTVASSTSSQRFSRTAGNKETKENVAPLATKSGTGLSSKKCLPNKR